MSLSTRLLKRGDDVGAHVLAASLLLRPEPDTETEILLEALCAGRWLLPLPADCELRGRLHEAGVPATHLPALESKPGVYCLCAYDTGLPDPASLGVPLRVVVSELDTPVVAPGFGRHAVDAVARWLSEGLSLPWKPGGLSLSGTDLLSQPVDDSATRGESAGLAGALAVATHLKYGSDVANPDICVAATGVVKEGGAVAHVEDLPAKLEGLVREAPWVKRVFVPRANVDEVVNLYPDGFLTPVDTVAEALDELLGKPDALLLARLDPAEATRRAHRLKAEKKYDDASALAQAVVEVLPTKEANDAEAALRNEMLPLALRGMALETEFRHWTRLVFEIPFLELDAGGQLPGWQRCESTDDLYGYWSRLHILSNVDFKEATKEILVWDCGGASAKTPALFQLDNNLLRGRVFLHTDKGEFIGKVVRADLVPLRHCRKGALSLWVAGESTTVREYLAWTGSRVFAPMKLSDRRGKTERFLQLGAVLSELLSALTGGRSPVFEDGKSGSFSMECAVCRYLLSPESDDWGDGSERFEAAWPLVATLSRPGPDYPKGPEPRLSTWKSDDALLTRYGCHDTGFTVWSSGNDAFNRETKPKVVLEGQYTSWLLARELARMGISAEHAAGVAGAYTQPVRRDFFTECCRFMSAG